MKKFWKIFRTTWMIVTPMLLAASLAFNLLTMAGGVAFDMASSAFEAVTGNRSVATRQANTTKKLNKEVAYQKKLNRELNTKVASLTNDLAAQKLAAKSVSADKMVIHKGKRTTAKAAVLATTATISRRAATTASRSAGSVVGEAIPYAGAAVIVGVTALELYDLCETVKEMNALSRAFDPSLEPDSNQTTVCSMEVPTRQEVWAAAKEKPGDALAAMKDVMPTLEELRAIELPYIDWEDNWDWTVSQVDLLVDNGLFGMAYLWEGTQTRAEGIRNGFYEWWLSEENLTGKTSQAGSLKN